MSATAGSDFQTHSHGRPVIGLSTYVERAKWGVWEQEAVFVPSSYVQSVTRVGGLPVLLPPVPDGDPAGVLTALDGLMVIGGRDVGPGRYGAEPHPETDRPQDDRDEWEMALCRAALQEDLPLLAICRGVQILNVTLGGTLHQHLPDAIGSDRHRPELGKMTSIEITLDASSPLAKIFGPQTEGLCHHHQAIDRLGTRMHAIGFAADGTVEAVEVLGQEFALGVQWHPEDNPDDDRLVAAFVGAASSYRAER